MVPVSICGGGNEGLLGYAMELSLDKTEINDMYTEIEKCGVVGWIWKRIFFLKYNLSLMFSGRTVSIPWARRMCCPGRRISLCISPSRGTSCLQWLHQNKNSVRQVMSKRHWLLHANISAEGTHSLPRAFKVLLKSLLWRMLRKRSANAFLSIN